MANLIQIKRSSSTATPLSLANGELAFSSVSDALFIGSPNGSVVAIGGARNPGTLTANQALVANATGYIDIVKTANLVVGAVSANGSYGTNGQVLVSNGSGVFWGTGTSGSNTQVQFNDGGVANGSAAFTFDKTSNTLTVTNFAGNGASITSVNAATVGGNTASDLQTYADNKAANAYSNATSYADTKAANAYSNAASYADTVAGNAYTNAVSYANTAAGTAYSNAASYADAKAANAYSNATSYADAKAANAYSNATSYADAKAANAYSNATSYADTKAGNAYSNAMADTLSRDGTYTGNNIFNGGTTTISNNVVLGSNGSHIVSINGVVNTNFIPSTNNTYDLGDTNKRWKDLYLAGNTFYFGSSVVTESGGVVTTNNITVTSDLKTEDLIVEGNTVLGNNTSDVVSFTARVNTDITPAANTTYNLGTNNLRWNELHAQNVHSTTGYFDGTIYVGGDVLVTGNLVTTNVSSVVVSDPLIYLAGNNYTSDVLDIGFAANYNDGANNRHTGFYRDASDSGIYKLFDNLTQELSGNNLIDDTDPSYRIATLKAFLISGALTTNTSTIAITANASVNVAIVANSLSLSTALPATSGGTGQSSFANGDILVASNSSNLAKLTLGSDGYVLQSNGSTLVYGTLDGGTF